MNQLNAPAWMMALTRQAMKPPSAHQAGAISAQLTCYDEITPALQETLRKVREALAQMMIGETFAAAGVATPPAIVSASPRRAMRFSGSLAG